ncbi:MAG: trypsin-like peptidase domain-containing protein [Defluviitaleaceae bacterium]|nr:trypsin-like peptidase domain-containing protein [Defluviitaleaceae bacterium]
MKTFKRLVVVVAIISILGGGSLGLGLSIGFNLGRIQVPSTANVNYYQQLEGDPIAFLFEEQDTETIPLDVRVSNITGVVQAVSGSVVSINIEVPTTNRFRQQTYHPGSGSGIIFSKDENFVYIATNNHVVDHAARIYISLDDEYQVEATFIGGDWHADLAVVSVPRSALAGKEYHVATFGDSDSMLAGDEVVAIGNPMGAGQIATRGIISAINRQITVDGRTLNVLQTDAAINPGNSGGALANINGEVIGINTAKAISFYIEGMGYAIPSNEALDILKLLLEEGTTPRPYLGIALSQVDERMKQMFALPAIGVMITGVETNSAAEQAGLEQGDLVVGFNQINIETAQDLANAISQSSVGEVITLSIYRRGIQPMDITVIVGDANAR